jgi:hypothetical protein
MLEVGWEAEIILKKVLSREQAAARQFLGSPTIRIDGVDIEPGADARHDYALACRAYVKGDGRISPLPPRELIRDAVARAASAGSG